MLQAYISYIIPAPLIECSMGNGTPAGNTAVPEPDTLICVQEGKNWAPRDVLVVNETSATCKDMIKAERKTRGWENNLTVRTVSYLVIGNHQVQDWVWWQSVDLPLVSVDRSPKHRHLFLRKFLPRQVQFFQTNKKLKFLSTHSVVLYRAYPLLAAGAMYTITVQIH